MMSLIWININIISFVKWTSEINYINSFCYFHWFTIFWYFKPFFNFILDKRSTFSKTFGLLRIISLLVFVLAVLMMRMLASLTILTLFHIKEFTTHTIMKRICISAIIFVSNMTSYLSFIICLFFHFTIWIFLTFLIEFPAFYIFLRFFSALIMMLVFTFGMIAKA